MMDKLVMLLQSTYVQILLTFKPELSTNIFTIDNVFVERLGFSGN